ncbi:TolC family protein [soil metagenome]
MTSPYQPAGGRTMLASLFAATFATVLSFTLVPTAMAQHSATTSAAPAIASNMPALSILPSEQSVRQTLENLPQLRASAINIELAMSGKSRLQAGTYEWTARVASNRRTDQNGDRFNEQELALERPVRWFGKAGKDAAIGEKSIEIAHAAHADTWHEAGRSLMKDWFDSLRESASVRSLHAQLLTAEQLRNIADKRVKAGDAAALELLQADTEARRVSVLLQQAQLRDEQMRQLLHTSYPGLPQPILEPLALPQIPDQPASFWLAKILDDNHELELAQAEADLFTLQAARIASDKMPDPTIGLRAGRERNGQERLIGISISIPLAGAARSADGASAHLKAKMAEERASLTRQKVTAMAQRVITDSMRSHSIWQTMQQIQQQSQTQAGKMMRAYQLGEATLTDALTTRRQALDAALANESAQIDALAAMARLHLDAHMIWSID